MKANYPIKQLTDILWSNASSSLKILIQFFWIRSKKRTQFGYPIYARRYSQIHDVICPSSKAEVDSHSSDSIMAVKE